MSRLKFLPNLILLIVLGLATLNINLKTFAQQLLPQGSIFITEINWDGSYEFDKTTANYKSNYLDEWIEIYNPLDTKVSLKDYKIKGIGTSGKDLIYKDITSCVVEPQSYLIVRRQAISPTINPLLGGDLGCIATNMSLSNTNINLTITNLDETITEIQFNGNPTNLISSLDPTTKYSIVKQNQSWIQTRSTIDLIDKDNITNLPFHHFASPGFAEPIFFLDIPAQIKSDTLPTQPLIPKIQTQNNTSNNSTTIQNEMYAIGSIDCNFNPNQYFSDLVFDTQGDFCIKTKFQLNQNNIAYIGYLDTKIKIINTAVVPKEMQTGIDITEIDLNSEKVEFYNKNSFEIDLSNYTLEDTVGVVKQFKISGKTLKPNGYTMIEIASAGITLNNTGDNLILKNEIGGIITQSAINITGKSLNPNTTWQYFKDQNTWEAQPETLGRENERITTSLDTNTENDVADSNLVKTAEQSKELDYFKSKLRINEIYPLEDEYIELHNQGDGDLDLSRLVLFDLKGKTNRYTLTQNTIIKAREYKIIELKNKITLNNDGDGVSIMTSSGDILDKIEFDFARGKGQSYQYLDGYWIWSEKTPATENKKNTQTDANQDLENGLVEDANSKSTTDKKAQNQNCQVVNILTRISKNIYFTDEYKINLADTPNQKLPYRAKICNIKDKEDYRQATFQEWIEPFSPKLSKIADNTKIDTDIAMVDFLLSCRGKKTVDIIREDIIFRSAYQIKKPICQDKFLNGRGLLIRDADSFILYYIEKNDNKIYTIVDNKTSKARLKQNSKKSTNLRQIKDAVKSSKINDLWYIHYITPITNHFKFLETPQTWFQISVTKILKLFQSNG